MADIFDEILGSELNLMFFVSIAAWILIFLYLFYTANKIKKLERELESLKDQ
ncbi:MAG: CcmD family protein [Candidatus Hodarchaeota archaeon]